MKPTNKLRFVRRTETHTPVGGTEQTREVTMLQQWWSDGWGPLEGTGEWRDVPLEVE